MVTLILVLVIVVVLGIGLWFFAAHARDVDEDIRYMNEGRGLGPGIFGIFRRNRD